MQVFITGTDTDIGKTIVSAWLCLHTRYDYFKPIQTGAIHGTDSELVQKLTNVITHTEAFLYNEALSPHLAARLKNEIIDIKKIHIPKSRNIIIEGAGGVMTPINCNAFMRDLIQQFSLPVILVASSRLGTINHTLLSLEALRANNIQILGVIVSGELNQFNCNAIEDYGNIKVLAQVPFLNDIKSDSLREVMLTEDLKKILKL